MKGKKITSLHPLVGALSFLDAQLMSLTNPGAEFERRQAAINDEVGDITIDTCIPSDTGVWETGIIRESIESKWVIVSQYEEEEEAILGHNGWLRQVTEDPTCELKDIDMWNLDTLS